MIISISLSLSTIFKPGVGLNLSNSNLGEVTIKEATPLVEVLLDMIPSNPIASMANGNMLQIIVFSILIDVGLSALGEKTKMITNLFKQLNDLIMKIIYGIDLNFSAFLTVILTATLASIWTAGVPGVRMIMLSMVLQSVGLPVEGIALIMGIDRILDMSRTAVNITGDAVCTLIVAKAEGEFNEEIFNSESVKK